ncbi:DNA gyrase subunit A [Limihaloglobus sulfuriphilus]|uniref:DNA gyrase subunit A n=1 Tax=Limihaloglobus sulfuriphilus TaxID=1851148 RepID=A0A1Q2MD45_9BACT|nr:DNA gyrase subunit A [Limihaloglobus sulfuriphilus]AQQ70623.1 DNA gyrase subunit A [Limihaloglobus sulfuriphilus]
MSNEINTEVMETFESMPILEEMKTSYLNYAMSVIVSRALPDVRDGLKPSQRRILVAMNDLSLGPRSKHRKCAKIAGDTSGNYHPHGESVVYPTLVRMGQHWSMRSMLVDPQGNFGSIDGDPPAAMRYTEARMTSVAMEMLQDLKQDTVDFIPNYDETRNEPVVLPSKFPNLLINGSTGIAVGMATNMAPHNLNEICDAAFMIMDNPDCSIAELMDVLPGPDFPTGGLICGRKGIYDAFTTGKGHVKLRCKHTIEETKSGKQRIVVTEIPYTVVKTNIVSKIADCVHEGILTEVSDVRDESDRKGLRIVVELKRDANADVVINKLFRYTQLSTTFAINNVALVNSRPETLNIKQLIIAYLDHRKEVIRRRTRFLLNKSQARAHILEGLILAVSDIDEIIELIKASPDAPTAKVNLMQKPLRLIETATLKNLLPEDFLNTMVQKDQFLTGPQADAILTMQLQKLTGLETEKLAKEFAALMDEIKGYQAILADEKLVLNMIKDDLQELKDKYGDSRRTEISDAFEDLDEEDLIADEETVVIISHQGYIKRMPIDTYRKQGRGGRGILGSDSKDDDFVEHLFVASTHDYLMIFTSDGKCYWLKVYKVPGMSRQSKGRSIANLLELGDEKIMSIKNVRTFDDRQLVFATRKGIIKKTTLSAYGNVRSNGIKAINLDDDDDLISVKITGGNDDILLATANGMSIRFNESDVRSVGRVSRGVKGITLRKGDEVVGMVKLEDGDTVLTVCENGYGKRTELEEYRTQSRGGKGIINIKVTERNGKVVGVLAVTDDDDVMMMTRNGIVIRTGLDQMRTIGRNTAGVRMIKVGESDVVSSIARLIKDDSEEDTDETVETAETETSETE